MKNSIKLSILGICTFLLASFAPSTKAADLAFTTSINPGGTIFNSVTGEYGGRFINTTGTQVTITHLARWVVPGNNQTHTLRLYENFGTLLSSVVVNCQGATPNEFIYGQLPSPVVVPIGGIVYILSTETAGGDFLHDGFGAGATSVTRDIGIIETGFFNTSISSLQTNGGIGRSWGPVTFRYSSPVPTWTKQGRTYTTDGTMYQVSSAIADASPGDIIRLPAGSITWGEGGTRLVISKPVSVLGAGMGITTINMHSTSPTGFGNAIIQLSTGATFGNLTLVGPNSHAGAFVTGATEGWRITKVEYLQHVGTNPYFVFAQYAPSGLIDGCVVTGGAGNSELVFARGVSDSWDTDSSLGGSQNIFIEDCMFKGEGYVCDANANARMVVRNVIIEGRIKIDGHGVWSNGGPQRGVRHMEVYRNHWKNTSAAWTAIEMRGGTGMIWGNTSDLASTTSGAWFYLTEYGVFNNNGAFTPNFQTAADYPIRDQIGRGKYSTPGEWTTATSEPMYLWNNLKGGAPWPLEFPAIPVGSINRYRAQTGNPAATFSWEDVVQANRDYFRQVVPFTGGSGVGIGTKTEMLAIVPTKTGVGFWVTNEGTWDKTLPANTSGQLYTWNGTAWSLKYTPYTYPHPLRIPSAPSNLRTNP